MACRLFTMRESIAKFWCTFTEHQSALEQLISTKDPVYDLVLKALHKLDTGLFFEFCMSPGMNEFIVNADGTKELFPLVEEIVRGAPEINGWKFFALKPKRGFPLTTSFDQHDVALKDVLVQPVFSPSGELGLHLYLPDIHKENTDDAHNALLRALDAGLGEKRFAESVSATWGYPISEAPESAFSLVELDDYITYRER